MGRKPIEMKGKVFHQLTVLHRDGSDNHSKPMYVCKCSCGKLTRVSGNYLRIGKTKSCGCRTTATHGMSQHPLWGVWNSMLQRCRNKNVKNFHRYGGRGISVCKEWNDSESFINWCLINGWEKGKDLDRIDNDGPYSPNNCRFADRSTNCFNKEDSLKNFRKNFNCWKVVKNIPFSLKGVMECKYCGKEDILNKSNVISGRARKCSCLKYNR